MKTKNFTVPAAFFLALACASSALADMATAVVEVKKSSKSKDGWRKECSIKVQYPTDAASNVAKIINEYINERLGGSYAGDLFDVKAMVAHYIDKCLASHHSEKKRAPPDHPKEDGPPGYPDEEKYEIVKIAETGKYVTYEVSTYYCEAGMPHGHNGSQGMTFRKSDGRTMGWDDFVNTENAGFNDLIKNGLKQYWRLKTDAELEHYMSAGDFLVHGGSLDNLPTPWRPPLFMEEGVKFSYNPYEMAAYGQGMPQFVVPYAQIARYLSRAAREIVEP